MLYRAGFLCFVARIFVNHGLFKFVMDGVVVSALSLVIIILLFFSLDVIKVLVSHYEFWFISALNAVHWMLFSWALGSSRALICGFAWFSLQSVSFVDANHRSFRQTIASVILATPLLVGTCMVLSFQLVDDARTFDIVVSGDKKAALSDMLEFTTFTLAVFMVKLAIVKRNRIHSSFPGYSNVPCVLCKATLRLRPVRLGSSRRHGITVEGVLVKLGRERSRDRLSKQQLILGRLPAHQIDARHTFAPISYLLSHPAWLRHRRGLRFALKTVGLTGYCALAWPMVSTLFGISSVSTSPSISVSALLVTVNGFSAVLGFGCTLVFCGTFVLFYQRELLKLVLLNFDFLFSSAQATLYTLCLCDMARWNDEHTLVMFSWLVWLLWALTLDALTPVVKRDIFRFSKRLAAPVMITILAANCTVFYVLIFSPKATVGGRELLRVTVHSSYVYSVRTNEIVLGRVVMMFLWCSRQVVLLLTRKEDELNLIRGFVEYLSPYASFPSFRAGPVAPSTSASCDDGRRNRLRELRLGERVVVIPSPLTDGPRQH
ncbi:hypothetical protein Poli38472_010390 [Pythium oligandrum]|uniref:Transmembrane protein n=1 Tax=Pythium oligandrum TaxID=41045 RepID=A0A8K1C356_PYTOL|nr:hypothetical protein Poli38472_010390 [Pythium oligandrum]|eukprot:TMW55508.1 hypothetical protein Poli38472_010390 [Pythium oligandrum]